MKTILDQTDDELWITLEWDRIYGPEIQSRNKRGLGISKRLLAQARSEYRSLSSRITPLPHCHTDMLDVSKNSSCE